MGFVKLSSCGWVRDLIIFSDGYLRLVVDYELWVAVPMVVLLGGDCGYGMVVVVVIVDFWRKIGRWVFEIGFGLWLLWVAVVSFLGSGYGR